MPAPAGSKRVKVSQDSFLVNNYCLLSALFASGLDSNSIFYSSIMPVSRRKRLSAAPKKEVLIRVKGKSVSRPFIYGSKATLLPADLSKRPPNTPPDHTHQWTVYVRGVNDADITHWLKKVQFKLHETYAQSQRIKEAPDLFEVTETGWGEFEIGIKLFFPPESGEKSISIYHQLKLHHFGEDKEAAKERGDPVISELYEEIVFNEPAEAFYEVLTTDPAANARAKTGSKAAKAKQIRSRTAEIPEKDGDYSQAAEAMELHRIREANKKVEELIAKDKLGLIDLEKELEELKKDLAKG